MAISALLPVFFSPVQTFAILPQSMKKHRGGGKYKIIPESAAIGDDYGGFFVSLDDLKIIYHALKAYQPTEDEEQLYELLLESFEEELWTETHLDEN